MKYNPEYEKQFIVLCGFTSGGSVRIHKMTVTGADDFRIVFWVAVVKAMSGSRVDILPVLQEKDPLRSVIYFDAKINKNPDLRIDGVLCEVEHPGNPEKLNTLKHRIKEGARQADYVIIGLDVLISINLMRRACKGKFLDFKNLKRVEYVYKSDSFVFRREDFFYGYKEPVL